MKHLFVVVYATTSDSLDVGVSDNAMVYETLADAKRYFDSVKRGMDEIAKENGNDYEVIKDDFNEYTLSNYDNDGMTVKMLTVNL